MRNLQSVNPELVLIERGAIRRRLLSATVSLTTVSTLAANSALAFTSQPAFSPNAYVPAVPSHAHGNAPGVFGSPTQVVHPQSWNAHTNSWQLHPVVPVTNSVVHSQTKSTASNTNQSLSVQNTSVAANGSVDLSSTTAQFEAGSLAGFHTITLNIGGQKQEIDFGTKLTGAELVAAQQVLSSGKQQLIIDASGAATGGRFNLNTGTISALDTALGGAITGLDISHGVVAVDTLPTLSLSGSLTNAGTIDLGAPSGSRSQSVDLISAANIYNQAGAVITSAVGVSGVKATDVSLSSSSSVVNNGTISASQNLTVSSPSIVNSSSSSAAQAVLSAGNNINLASGNLTNSGLISAAKGNVNISNGGSDITVSASGGTVQAPKGDINFNAAAAAGTANITVNGGNWLSQQLNFNAGSGDINADLGQVTGVVNGTAGVSHVTAATADLQLGEIAVSGDPTYYNTAGDITIDSTVSATNGADLAIVASGNIIGNGGKLDTSSATNGGNLTLIAGAEFSSPTMGSGNNDSTTTISIGNGPGSGNGSSTGGYIDLSGITLTGSKTNQSVSINTSGAAGSGGNVLMVAYAGTGSGSGPNNSGSVVTGPTVAQNKGASSINMTGSTTDGGLTIYAGGASISLQNVSLSPVNGTGSIVVVGATPVISNGGLTITNGTVTGGYDVSTALTPTTVTVGNLTANSISLTTGGNINQVKSTVVSANTTVLDAVNVGASKAPFVTNTATSLELDGNTSAGAVYVSEQNGTMVTVSGSSSAPGQSLSLTSIAAELMVNNLNFTNVAIVDNGTKTMPGNIAVSGASGDQIGELYSNPNALGTGVISLTASGTITENSAGTQAVIVGRTVTLNSSGADIGSSPSSPLTIAGATLTANAVKGNVYINDLVQTTLNAGTAGTSGTFTYDVTGNGLAVAGAINGNVIMLSAGPGTVSGGPGTVLDINANVGSTKTLQLFLNSTAGILQTNAKAVATAQDIVLSDSASGNIGSAAQPVLTKASDTLQVNGYLSGTSGTNAYITQTGPVSLLTSGNSTSEKGSLALTDSGALTVGSASATAVNFNTVTLTAPSVAVAGTAALTASTLNIIAPITTIAMGGTVSVSNASFLSTGAISVSGAGTITATNSLAFSSPTGGLATSVTLGNASGGASNPLSADLNASLASLSVLSKGNFTLDTNAGITSANSNTSQINITASNIVDSNATPQPIVISTNSAAALNSLALTLTGTQAVVDGTSGPAKSTLLNLTAGNLSLNTKGALTISQALSGQGDDFFTPSLTVTGNGNISTSSLIVASPIVTTAASQNTITASNNATFTANGALSISGLGAITPGTTLSLGSGTILGGGALTVYTTKSITLGVASTGANDPLSASFDSASSVLSNLTISTTGAFVSNAGGLYLNPSNPQALNFTAATAPVSRSTTDPFVISVSGAGVAPGTATVNITGTGTTNLGSAAGQIQLVALTDQSSGGGSLSATSKGNMTFGANAVELSSNGTVSLTSTGGTLFNTLNTNGIVFGSNTNDSVTLSGAKGLSINNSTMLQNPAITSLTLGSGATTPFVIGGTVGTKGLANGTAGPIGTISSIDVSGINTTSTSVITSLTINTGGGITINTGGFIASNPTSTMTLTSTGMETIVGVDSSVFFGSTLSITGKTGVTLGAINPFGTPDPFDRLQSANPVHQLTITSGGKLATGLETIDIGDPNYAGMLAPAVSGVTPAVSPAYDFFCGLYIAGLAAGFFPSPGSFLGIAFGFAGGGLSAPAVSPAVTPQTAAVNIVVTGSSAVNLGSNVSSTIPTFLINMASNISGSVSVQTAGALTVGDSGMFPGITTGASTVSLMSGGNLTVNPQSIVLNASSTNLSLTSAKNLAVLDPNLLNGGAGALSSVSLSSVGAKSFVVDQTTPATITNGTAGTISAPSVTILTPSLTVASAGAVTGTGNDSGSSLTLGGVGKGGFTFVNSTATNPFGSDGTTGFQSVSIVAAGNINLGNLFTTNVLPASSVSAITISGPTVLVGGNPFLSQSGAVTFLPTSTSLAVGDVAGSPTITILAKSITASNGFTFDTSSGADGTVSITTASPITVGTAKGDFQFDVTGMGSLSLQSTAGNLTFAGSGSLMMEIGQFSGNSVIVNQPVEAANGLVVQASAAGGKGIISTGVNGLLSTSGPLVIGQTSAKLSSTAINTDAVTIGFAGGALNINNNNTFANNTTVGNVPGVSLAALNLTTNATTSTFTFVNSITTTAGGINIVDTTSGGNLGLVAGALLSTNAGSILLNETSGAVLLATGASIHASGTAPGVGQVTIVTGAVPSASSLIAGTTPTPANDTPTMIQTVGGNVTYSVAGNTAGTIDVTGSGVVISALQRNVVFNGQVYLQGNNSITADPPVGASAPATPAPTVASVVPVSAQASTINVSAPLSISSLGSTPASSITIDQPMLPGAALMPAIQSNLSPSPALFVPGSVSGTDVTEQPAGSGSPLSGSPLSGSPLSGYPLSGSVSNLQSIEMGKGASLFVPQSDTVLKTDFGSVSLAAKSVVLVMSFDGGLAVYNLHDSKSGAVTISSAGKSFSLAPGRNVVLTARNIRYFEEINPAQCVAYKNMTALEHKDGLRSFTADFDIISLLQGFAPLKQLVASNDQHSRKAVNSMLKTAAILRSVGTAAPYQLMTAPQRMAMNSSMSVK